MYIRNICCTYKEYAKKGNRWRLVTKSNSYVDSIFIDNMLNSSFYFTSMGGQQDISLDMNRRFGLVVSKISSISFCGEVKKTFIFNYNNAKGGNINEEV